ncbi:MAG: hypothetical protein JW748_00515 [Anaerolineales bacterium]|nr:hypothetical protein [Anaerolineales bacterium]
MEEGSLLSDCGLATVGFEANTALFVQDGRMEMIGHGGVTDWSRTGRRRHAWGALLSWSP